MKRYLAFIFCAALIYANSSLASEINYNFFELGYLETELDVSDIDEDGDGYEFNASLGVSPTLAVVLGYQDVEFDEDIEADLLSLGIDYHKPYSNTGDIILGLAFLESEIDAPGIGKFDESGNELRLEIRSKSSQKTEFSIGLSRIEIDDDSDTGYFLGVVNGAPQGFQFVLRYTDREDTSSILVGLRSGF